MVAYDNGHLRKFVANSIDRLDTDTKKGMSSILVGKGKYKQITKYTDQIEENSKFSSLFILSCNKYKRTKSWLHRIGRIYE